jgi:hypothetical protein
MSTLMLTVPLGCIFALFAALGAHHGSNQATARGENPCNGACKYAFFFTIVPALGFACMLLVGLMAFGAMQPESIYRVLSNIGFALIALTGGFAGLGAYLGAHHSPTAASVGAAFMAMVGVCLGPWGP